MDRKKAIVPRQEALPYPGTTFGSGGVNVQGV